MYKLKEDSNGLRCVWKIVSITVFQSSSLLFVTFGLMLGTQNCQLHYVHNKREQNNTVSP